jgi:hypothetical protein
MIVFRTLLKLTVALLIVAAYSIVLTHGAVLHELAP